MRTRSDNARREGEKIGFVPTMGYLHEGHLDLMRLAGSCADMVVASIFVNPAQFGKNEDLDRYPRDLARDAELAKRTGCDILFTPTVADMYAKEHCTYVMVDGLSALLEGAIRPDHFRGVTTVVAKLFNIVKPHVAIFGQKDAQQAVIIKKMARELNYDVEILLAPTRRESDGLAMSSRNTYLAPAEREDARALHRGLRLATAAYRNGERRSSVLKEIARSEILKAPLLRLDYVEIVDIDSLTKIEILAEGDTAFMLVAARIGTTRLIDNILLGLEA